tara:strand:- start:20768 stop:21280 length:513 start_codon:yes stop_codon:yes gene_type:complete
MDGIFSNELSNTLQMFTFPLEVIGLTLAAVEVRFPELAARLAGYVSREAKSMTPIGQLEMWNAQRRKTSSLSPIREKMNLYLLPVISYTRFMPIALGLTFVGMIIISILNADFHGLLMMSLLMLVVICYGSLIYFADRFVEGRAVGTLGIIIAGLGVLGEAYQFTALLLV